MHLKPTAECQISITLPSLIYFSWDIYREPGNTFNLISKGAKTLPFLIYFYDIFIETALHNLFSNIKIDI
jgi:hypothetical protein